MESRAPELRHQQCRRIGDLTVRQGHIRSLVIINAAILTDFCAVRHSGEARLPLSVVASGLGSSEALCELTYS